MSHFFISNDITRIFSVSFNFDLSSSSFHKIRQSCLPITSRVLWPSAVEDVDSFPHHSSVYFSYCFKYLVMSGTRMFPVNAAGSFRISFNILLYPGYSLNFYVVVVILQNDSLPLINAYEISPLRCLFAEIRQCW